MSELSPGSARRGCAATGKGDQVALGIAEERHLLGLAGRAELAPRIDEDGVRLRFDRDAFRSKSFGLEGDVIDTQVEERGRRRRIEEQPHIAEIEEGKSRGLEAGHEPKPDDIPVERHCAIHVINVLGNLAKVGLTHEEKNR